MTEFVGQYSAFMQGCEASNNDEKLREKYDKLVGLLKEIAKNDGVDEYCRLCSGWASEDAKELLKEIQEIDE